MLADKLQDKVTSLPFPPSAEDDVSVLVKSPTRDGIIHRLGFPVQPRGGQRAIAGYFAEAQSALNEEILLNSGASAASLAALRYLCLNPGRFGALGVVSLLAGSALLTCTTLHRYTDAAASAYALQQNESLFRNFGPIVFLKNLNSDKRARGSNR